MALIPASWAASSFSSTSTLWKATSGKSFDIASILGATCRHGPHQVAQKSTTVSLSRPLAVSKSALVSRGTTGIFVRIFNLSENEKKMRCKLE